MASHSRLHALILFTRWPEVIPRDISAEVVAKSFIATGYRASVALITTDRRPVPVLLLQPEKKMLGENNEFNYSDDPSSNGG
ncbi:hypothetical protein TNIN_429231 [Trichonephila inaurata madagascariensis]|uniref:Uncharacterized protein n=1 Tax=Trichonephila inaurata madagascariensis TaxID=2747483 RepID=A0A8X6XWP6_9ARAC|nr:hypothetical protein TNIN_429231 [Trichonephila inaurata madagascariensis]